MDPTRSQLLLETITLQCLILDFGWTITLTEPGNPQTLHHAFLVEPVHDKQHYPLTLRLSFLI